jgi:hypothetical protein
VTVSTRWRVGKRSSVRPVIRAGIVSPASILV